MSKVAIVYWSGTGNTEAMAKAIEEGAKGAGGDVSLFEVESFKASSVPDYDGLIFGCPAMGDEVLEEGSFEPLFTDAEKHLSGKPVALFTGQFRLGGVIVYAEHGAPFAEAKTAAEALSQTVAAFIANGEPAFSDVTLKME